MPKRTDVKKVLIIGSGPIVIGQAAEFDYAGTQACLALREEGCEVVLVNSNPATIMTDPSVADKVYMEPLTLDSLAAILRRERPDAIVPGIGGQTGLNLAMQLERSGVLRACGTKLLGTNSASIERAEDREKFKRLCQSLGEPVIPSEVAYDLDRAKQAAARIGYPVVLRPAFTLGGTGGGFADSEEELVEIAVNALRLSPVHQVLVEKSVRGYKEIEFELMRDARDTVVTVCGMENVDPVGVHTGDSIVTAPILSLSAREQKMLNASAVKLIRALEIEGGCNIQFALAPDSSRYYLIEVNPRVSRSSALASKASGYPIARVSAKIAIGLALEEIPLAGVTAAVAPRLDYYVAKFPRFPFDKFPDAPNTLGTQMKSTGEVMGIGSTLEECFLKAVRSLETGMCHLYSPKFDPMTDGELLSYLSVYRHDSIFAMAELLRRGCPVEKLHAVTGVTALFLEAMARIVDMERELKRHIGSVSVLAEAKRMGFSDRYIARLWDRSEAEIGTLRREHGVVPVFHAVDTLHTGRAIPCLYSSYTGENASRPSQKKKILVLGAGPIRIGQGIEFDYSTVHAVQTIKRRGWEAIIVNNNPETVSTDYSTADRLYFEPLTVEDVMAVVEYEKPAGVIASLGGQTALNLARPLCERGVTLIGTDCAAIERAENRDRFEKLLLALHIPQPPGAAVGSVEEGVRAAAAIGYPVLVRPSFVLGGRAMEIVADEGMLRRYLKTAVEIDADEPVLVDKYIPGREVELDAVCDGRDVFVPGLMELVERTGVHSGDSISVYPPVSLSAHVEGVLLRYAKALGLGVGIVGPFNLQFIVDRSERVFVIELNPRSSRTVPFLSKAGGWPLADIATEVMLGRSLKDQGLPALCPEERRRWYVKVPVFSWSKLKGLDAVLSPEMKSTGEAIGHDESLPRALYKALLASGMTLHRRGAVLVTLADEDKAEALPLVRRFFELGFSIEATAGTAAFLKRHGVPALTRRKLSEGSDEIPEAIRAGSISYILNTRAPRRGRHLEDGAAIRRLAAENNVTLFTSLDTVRVLLDALEEGPADA